MLKVATFFKEERDPLYQRGEAKGLEKGEAKGLQKGLEEARRETAKNLLLSGRFTEAEIALFVGVSEELVLSIKSENNL